MLGPVERLCRCVFLFTFINSPVLSTANIGALFASPTEFDFQVTDGLINIDFNPRRAEVGVCRGGKPFNLAVTDNAI
jgi:hypothetical protein